MARRSTGYNAVKYLFYVFNVLVLLFGCGILCLGIWLQASKGPSLALDPSHSFLSGTVLCIIVGVIVVFVGMLGCCGSLMDNPCMLAAYFVFVVLLFVGEVVVGSLAFVYSSQIKETVREEMVYSIRYQYDKQVSPDEYMNLSDMWYALQRELQCCGVNNFTDWYQGLPWQNDEMVPDSCCVKMKAKCGERRKSTLYTRGCLGELEYWVISNLYILGVVAITVGVVQILAVAASILLFCTAKKDKFEI